MKSKYTELIDRNCPLPEYPRPQLRRDNYKCLNGEWECCFTSASAGAPSKVDRKILVPFSPESELSGVGRSLAPNELLWYRRKFTVEQPYANGNTLLHFGAVDQTADVYVNGKLATTHVGGYTPFSGNITGFLISGENELVVRVRDITDTGWQSRGKQRLKRGGIWYTPQSGIWQTVWLECVPSLYVTSLRIIPDLDDGSVSVTVHTNRTSDVSISACGKTVSARSSDTAVLKLDSFGEWSPESPTLYDLSVQAGEDCVTSYFGMRKFEVRPDSSGVNRLFLNNRPYFHTGVLDQGYYSDGMLTPPCDKAIVDDILLMKSMGFNTLRKHIKMEPLRWYYHCDRLGMLVWQDMINGGESYKPLTVTAPCFAEGLRIGDHKYSLFGRENADGRRQYYVELYELLTNLINCVSIAMWVPFNEGWVQFDAESVVRYIRDIDKTRTIDHASGWHDQYIGNTKSLHVYFRPYKFRRDKLNRAVMLTEFGGYSLRIDGHCFCKKTFGYKEFEDNEALLRNFVQLYEEQIIPAKAKGLCASIYTQLSDVEDEVNGFVTYDRAVVKLNPDDVALINSKLRD